MAIEAGAEVSLDEVEIVGSGHVFRTACIGPGSFIHGSKVRGTVTDSKVYYSGIDENCRIAKSALEASSRTEVGYLLEFATDA